GNLFAPRPTTEGETAAGYGQATIEQALAMAVRMVKRFKAGAPQIGSDTDAAIRAVLRDKYRSEAPDGRLHVQSYRLLAVETVSGTPKAGMTGHVTIETVYLIVCHMKYRVNEKPEEVEDGIVPAAVTFSIDENGAYALKEYWTPGAGAAYKGDIQAKFPAAAADEALRIEQYAGALKEDAREQAAEYLAGLIQ
ncbi:MAG: hypothetical protein IK136_03820, partial [Oscillospiraceae bacterium]|nr:hypothetical protein [Oscillospiraceae bacterium]